MLSKSLIIGSPSITDNFVSDKEYVLKRLGGNSGNMVFTESLLRNLPGSMWHSAKPNYEEADCIVISAANWLNSTSDFGWIADRIEKTDLPVFMVGVGAQSDLGHSIPSITAGTLRLLNIVSERSKLISTRGRFSSEVLEHYGIKNSSPTGCPSLLLCGAEGPRFSSNGLGPQVILHGTRHGVQGTNDFQTYLYRQAYKLGTEILLQSELPDVHIGFGEDPFKIDREVAHMVTATYGAQNYENLVDYLRSNAAFFHNFDDWLAYCKTKDFFVGSRIHGTILALIAGTPAVLIAHDARTIELAQTLNVPYVLSSQINTGQDLDFNELYGVFARNDISKTYHNYRQSFMDFFVANGINGESQLPMQTY